MSKDKDAKFKKVYPNLRYFMKMYRNTYINYKDFTTGFVKRSESNTTVPTNYGVCNTNTVDSDINLNILSGSLPEDLSGNMYICQCLGTPKAFMVGDTNIVKMNFSKSGVTLQNRMMWSPASIAKVALQKSTHRFDHVGLMFMSPGMGIYSYTEGMYLLPDGRLGITSDVDRPWIINRDSLKVETPLGKRSEWLPMMSKDAGDVMGNLFAGYSNSHVIYNDVVTNEVFLVNYQGEQADKSHPCYLMRWDGVNDLEKWSVLDENGDDILVKQSIHELVFTKDYIILADSAFVTGAEILSSWKNAPLPNKKTITYIIDRRDLKENIKSVNARKFEIDEACIHLVAEYDNPNDVITMYMLHTPATNTAEIIRSFDKDLNGKRFPENMVGYGTLPVLDLSSVGKHTIDLSKKSNVKSMYIRNEKFCWGPYMYTYMGRQLENYNKQDLFVMFKGFKKDTLPKRIFKAYSDVDNRRVSLEKLVEDESIKCNNSIVRIRNEDFKAVDVYEMPDKSLLYTISCMQSTEKYSPGYILAGVVVESEHTDLTSGHEYWIFDASNLAGGPICKLGHSSLNNSVLFHTVYLTDKQEIKFDKIKPEYFVPIKKDYTREELKKWNPEVLEVFEKTIWPYFENDKKYEVEVNRTLTEYSRKRIENSVGKEYLIGEQEITDAPAFANKMFGEANRMFASSGWKEEYNKKGILVESKEVSGIFEKSGVLVTRAKATLNISADTLFEYMTSPEGYAIIDPVSDPNDHKKEPLEVYEWEEGARLEAALATTELKVLPPSDFVVLNAINPKVRIFASKSILHDSMPGGSKYSGKKLKEGLNERAINTFVIKVIPNGEKKCDVLCINYADMCGNTSASMNNFINCKVFFPPLYKRMKDSISKIK